MNYELEVERPCRLVFFLIGCITYFNVHPSFRFIIFQNITVEWHLLRGFIYFEIHY